MSNISYIRRSVREFYESFAIEFSKTRVFPWKEVVYYYKLLEGSEIICDIGCGNGRHSKDLLDKCEIVIGLDISFSLLKIANERFKNKGLFIPVNADACYLPFKDSSISHIVSVATLHHIPSKVLRRRFVKECNRVLKEKGMIIVTSWSLIKPRNFIASLTNYIRNLLKGKFIEFGDAYLSWGKSYKRYFHFLTSKELLSLFKESKVIHLTRFGKGILKENELIIALKIS